MLTVETGTDFTIPSQPVLLISILDVEEEKLAPQSGPSSTVQTGRRMFTVIPYLETV